MPLDDDVNSKRSEQKEPLAAGLARSGQKHVEDMISFQREFSSYIKDLNENWLAHMQSEAALASEFTSKLSETQSIPETANLCQEWANRRVELFAEDGKRFFTGIQKFMETGVRTLASGW
jgi:Phasin protein